MLSSLQHAELLISARTPEQYTAVGQALASVSAPLAAMSTLLAQPAADPAAARALLAQLVVHLRELDVSQGGGHTRTADVLALYAATQVGKANGEGQVPACEHTCICALGRQGSEGRVLLARTGRFGAAASPKDGMCRLACAVVQSLGVLARHLMAWGCMCVPLCGCGCAGVVHLHA